VIEAVNSGSNSTNQSTQGSLNPDDQKKKDDDTKKGAAVCK